MVSIAGMPETRAKTLRMGFLSLNDSAPLAVAQANGFFLRRGLAVQLSREAAWSSLRDKLFRGELEAVLAPAPMLWAAQLGLGGAAFPVCTALVVSRHGNAITLSSALRDAGVTGAPTLRSEALRRRGERRLTFGVMDRFSTHNLHLRAWLRAAQLDPDQDVRIVVGSPAQLFRSLFAGTIDGYCAGEPWNSIAVQARAGWCPAWGASLTPGQVEAVLMVRTQFAEEESGAHADLVGALTEAAAWCDESENRPALAALLAEPAYLNLPEAAIAPALTDRFDSGYGHLESAPDFHLFHRGGVGCPTLLRGVSLQEELVTLGLVPPGVADAGLPGRLFREDLYLSATMGAPAALAQG